jgi:trk system potassium uptake protein TrkA
VNVIVVRAGEVGSNIAANLAAAHDITVIDWDRDRVEDLTYSQDVLALQGDGTSLTTLREATVADADITIASTDHDETNLVICGTAARPSVSPASGGPSISIPGIRPKEPWASISWSAPTC